MQTKHQRAISQTSGELEIGDVDARRRLVEEF